VEAAIILPVLFVLMFGIYEFSWLFYQQHLISIGLRDAARYLARSKNACDMESTNWRTAQQYASNIATTGAITSGVLRVKGWTSAMVVARCTSIDNPVGADGLSAYRGGPTIFVVTVSTKFIDPSLGLFGLVGLRPPTILVTHSERVIGPG
jgi:Flp pilus assembly protein TadG